MTVSVWMSTRCCRLWQCSKTATPKSRSSGYNEWMEGMACFSLVWRDVMWRECIACCKNVFHSLVSLTHQPQTLQSFALAKAPVTHNFDGGRKRDFLQPSASFKDVIAKRSDSQRQSQFVAEGMTSHKCLVAYQSVKIRACQQASHIIQRCNKTPSTKWKRSICRL